MSWLHPNILHQHGGVSSAKRANPGSKHWRKDYHHMSSKAYGELSRDGHPWPVCHTSTVPHSLQWAWDWQEWGYHGCDKSREGCIDFWGRKPKSRKQKRKAIKAKLTQLLLVLENKRFMWYYTPRSLPLGYVFISPNQWYQSHRHCIFSFSLQTKVAKAAMLSLMLVLVQQSASNRAVCRSSDPHGLSNPIFTLQGQKSHIQAGEREMRHILQVGRDPQNRCHSF